MAARIVESGCVDNAVGWPSKVSDSVALAFSRALYAALGDGLGVAEAVKVATHACGDTTPVLATAGGAAAGPLLDVKEGAR
jgi:hypothetical protein